MKRLLALLAALFALAVHAQEAQKAAPKPGDLPDPKIIEGLFACLAPGLPQDWQKTWLVVRLVAESADGARRTFEADSFYATRPDDAKGDPLTPCGAERIISGVGSLNDYLQDDQLRWTRVTITFTRNGKYEAKYDYAPVAAAEEKPAAKPAAKAPAKPAAKAAVKPAARPSGQGLRIPQ